MQNTAIINEILFEHGYLSPDDALEGLVGHDCLVQD